MKNRERKVQFHLYFSEDEYALLKKRTIDSGMTSMADFVRKSVVYGFTYTVDFSELHKYNWLLSNLSNNLNQIAHQANSSGHTTNSDLKEALKIMEEVWQSQKSMLSDLQFKNQ